MLQVVNASAPVLYHVTVRPRSVLRDGREKHILWLFIPLSILSAFGVGYFGPLLVLPGVAVLGVGLAWAYDHLAEHADDYESLTLSGSKLVLERKQGELGERIEVNGLWAQVVSRDKPEGGCTSLVLRFQGRELPFGRYLTDAERAWIGRDLRRLLVALRT